MWQPASHPATQPATQPPSHVAVAITLNAKASSLKSIQRRRKHCALAVVRRTHTQTNTQTDRGDYNALHILARSVIICAVLFCSALEPSSFRGLTASWTSLLQWSPSLAILYCLLECYSGPRFNIIHNVTFSFVLFFSALLCFSVWLGGRVVRTLDLRFESWPLHYRVQSWASC